MSHFDDMVDASTELFLRASLSHKHQVLPITGHCHNCDEPTIGHFCDNDGACRDDYDKRVKFNKGS